MAEPATCPSCGQPRVPGAFCSSCGARYPETLPVQSSPSGGVAPPAATGWVAPEDAPTGPAATGRGSSRRGLVWLIVTLVVLAFAVYVLGGIVDGDGAGAADRNQTASAAAATSPAAAGADTPSAVTPESSSPIEATGFAPINLSGTGAKVAKFEIPETAAAIATINHRGSSNFAVTSLDASGGTNELLVNEIGNYAGTVLFDVVDHSVAFEIEADGSWRIDIKPISAARAWDPSERLIGKGADVVLVSPPSSGLVTLDLTHEGESNFAVTSYTADSHDLLVNEIGQFSGQVLLPDGTLLLQVEADGSWSGTPG
jgi:hypothetical protein